MEDQGKKDNSAGSKVDDIDDVVDVEEFTKTGKKIPKAKKYIIRIDKEKFEVDVPEMTVREILELAGKTPVEQFDLFQKKKGGQPERLNPEATVDFTRKGVERFITLPLDQQEGEALTRQFQLPEEDTLFLDMLEHSWEAVTAANVQMVVIRNYVLPGGYSPHAADLMIRIVPGYPDAQIDMAYFSPAVSRTDGVSIPAVTMTNIGGQQWQQWSRHRTPANPWRPGVDNIGTHYAQVRHWLVRELMK